MSLQFLLLGLVSTGVGWLWDSFIALTAGTLGRFLGRTKVFLQWQKRVMGTLFLGLGVRLALQNRE